MLFLIDALFGIFIVLLMLRLIMQWARVDFYHPVTQFLLMVTSPPLRPLQRVIPRWRHVDVALIVLIVALQLLKRVLLHLLMGTKLGILGLLILSVADLLTLTIYIFTFAIIIQVVLSWVNPGAGYYQNPMIGLLHRMNEPLLAPVRRQIPPIQGVDISPLVVTLALQLALLLIVAPLNDLGAYLL